MAGPFTLTRQLETSPWRPSLWDRVHADRSTRNLSLEDRVHADRSTRNLSLEAVSFGLSSLTRQLETSPWGRAR